MSENLTLFAGPKAYLKIKDSGLQPDDVEVMPGAAGGPKWLILSHLDRALFSSWFKNRQKPLFLLGSSSGVWRFTASAQSNPISAIDRFQHSYTQQSYDTAPKPEEVSFEAMKIINHFMEDNGDTILSHPYIRLNIMTVRCKLWTAKEDKIYQGLGMSASALCNIITRKGLGLFFDRALFYDSRDIPPFLNMNGFPICQIPLNNKNIKPALLGSGSIPMVMSGVKNIPYAPRGTYRDGGVIDYHMDIPFNTKNIVLFPHYTNHIIPGWLDKKLFWRKPCSMNMDNVLLIAPSRKFINTLPLRKIPDRTDFYRFQNQDKKRIAYWNKAVDMSRCLADEFMELVQTGKIKDSVKPMP